MKENQIRGTIAAAALAIGAGGTSVVMTDRSEDPREVEWQELLKVDSRGLGSGCAADINGDGKVDFLDLEIMKFQFFAGPDECPEFSDFIGSANCDTNEVMSADHAQTSITQDGHLQNVSFYASRKVVLLPAGTNAPPVACMQMTGAEMLETIRNQNPHDEHQ